MEQYDAGRSSDLESRGEDGGMNSQLTCFVGSFPKRKRLSAFRRAIAEAWKDFGDLTFQFAADQEPAGQFLDAAREAIDRAFLCLFDVSEVRRSDVLLEIGYALGRDKDCLFLTKNGHEVPAALTGVETVSYGSLADLTRKLASHGIFPPVARATLRRRAGQTSAFRGELFSAVGRSLESRGRLDPSQVYEMASANGFSEEQVVMTLDVFESIGVAEKSVSEWNLVAAAADRLPRYLDELAAGRWS